MATSSNTLSWSLALALGFAPVLGCDQPAGETTSPAAGVRRPATLAPTRSWTSHFLISKMMTSPSPAPARTLLADTVHERIHLRVLGREIMIRFLVVFTELLPALAEFSPNIPQGPVRVRGLDVVARRAAVAQLGDARAGERGPAFVPSAVPAPNEQLVTAPACRSLKFSPPAPISRKLCA